MPRNGRVGSDAQRAIFSFALHNFDHRAPSRLRERGVWFDLFSDQKLERDVIPEMTGAQFIANFLERSGVTHVFWVPAVLMQTLREMEGKNRIQRILAHSEKAAVYMADGYARASRRPGVCFAQKIGASNLAAGLRDPHLACTPIVAITGTSNPNNQYRHNLPADR